MTSTFLGLIRCVGCDELVEIGTECLHCGYQDPYAPKEPDHAPDDSTRQDADEDDRERRDPEFSAA